MKSNFTFLTKNKELSFIYYDAYNAEQKYARSLYIDEFKYIKNIFYNIIQYLYKKYDFYNKKFLSLNDFLNYLYNNKIIDKVNIKYFLNIKLQFESYIKNENISSDDAILGLSNLYSILYWYNNTFFKNKISKFEFKTPTIQFTYDTSERKIIYIQRVDNSSGLYPAYDGLIKIGDASIPSNIKEADLSNNSEYIRKAAQNRINNYMTPANLPYKLEWVELAWSNNDKHWFRDISVHNVLKRSGFNNYKGGGNGREWYKIGILDAKKAIKAVKDGQISINSTVNNPIIQLRDEQEEAVNKTVNVFKKDDNMLWNAKMRFGKTLTALELIKRENYKKVLVMTHRPVVSDSWYNDFNKFNMSSYGYYYITKDFDHDLDSLNVGSKFICFLSIQDLRGSTLYNKNKNVFETKWDLIITDEAHEGTQTKLAQNIKERIKKFCSPKFLALSGTPFNLFDKFNEKNVFTWNYVMEQETKNNWNLKHKNEINPYEKIPKISMYTFNISEKYKYESFDKSFNFNEFFRVENKNFIHKNDVISFLDEISSPNTQNNYPFSSRKFRNNLKHTLWVLPTVSSAAALKKIMDNHKVFKDYRIINIVDNGDDYYSSQNDVEIVRHAITNTPSSTKTITLTVRKMTTGVTIPEWTAVMFLSNITSATQYLQAAFRAQTPFEDKFEGLKTNAYIFDFAPDRALTIMAEANSYNKGNLTNSKEEKINMKKLINFLPIIGFSNNSMQKYNVNVLFKKIKKVYAKKAYESGFSNTSIYSKKLLSDVTEDDLNKFIDLENIVGRHSSKKGKNKIPINSNGLDDFNYNELEYAEHKKNTGQNLNDEDKKKLEEQNAIKRRRRKLISILKNISIRIPLMIYGMDEDIDENISIKDFIKNIDDKSWQEFMPNGVSKELFRDFVKYYDDDVFIEAGFIIRNKLKNIDNLEPIDRAKELANMFSHFKNPDKETVLTPWKVVNLQLGQTIGGYSFFDKNYNSEYLHFIDNDISKNLLNNRVHVLEINSKTGLYPLYMAISLYYKMLQNISYSNAGKVNPKRIWKNILKNNIFSISKTEMAKTITKRTLTGYNNYDTNIYYIKNIVNKITNNIGEVCKEIRENLKSMKFDVVIGNPPYQELIAKKDTNNGQKRVRNIFQYFQELADNISDRYTVLIYPAGRWIHQNGKGLERFGYEQINDNNLSKIIYYPNANEIFPNIELSDGISIVLKDKNKNSPGFQYTYVKNNKINTISMNNPGDKLMMLRPGDIEISKLIDDFISKNDLCYLHDKKIMIQKLFKIESDFASKNPDKLHLMNKNENIDYSKYIKLLTNDKAGKMGRAKWFVADKDIIKVRQNLVNKWKVIVSSANAGGQKRSNQIEVVDNHSVFGRSRMALKVFDTKKEAYNFLNYAKSKFIRYTFLLTNESISSLGKEVPDIINYKDNNKFIDFSKNIDDQLFDLFNLTNENIKYIDDVLKEVKH